MNVSRPKGFEKLEPASTEGGVSTTFPGFGVPEQVLDAKGKPIKETADFAQESAEKETRPKDNYTATAYNSGANPNNDGEAPEGVKATFSKGPRIVHAMKGGSVLDYASQEIKEEQTLIGNRYLCRGAGMFVVAPSGQGKSTLAVQMAAEWALGWQPIGMSARESLRVLIIQAEDDTGDVTEMSQWIMKEGLFSKAQLEKIHLHTHIEPANDVVGGAFLAKLNSFLDQFKPDIVIINPYTSYLGGDVKDEKLANEFLRAGLTPILVKHGCAAVIMHHTPKTQYSPSTDFTTTDFMYRGMGCATMTNWARAYMVFEPVPNADGVFRFVACKRGKRLNWGGVIRYFRHSDNGELRWIPVSEEESAQLEAAKQAKNGRAIVVDEKKVLDLVPMLDPQPFRVVTKRISEQLKIGLHRAERELNTLQDAEKVWYSYPSGSNPNSKGGKPARYVSKTQPAEEDTPAE